VRPNYVYVASSWRNPIQTAVVVALRVAKIECYDFKHPSGSGSQLTSTGFHWSEVGVNSQVETFDGYIEGLRHDRSKEGFAADMTALDKADCCVLVLPCGRSAHLELGYAIGKGKRTAILFDDPEQVTPELMYMACDYLSDSLFDLLGWLGVED
jgi:hypothetical protein